MNDRCYCKVKRITVTKDHLKLINKMYVSWQDTKYGAPEINTKRPYGNSSVTLDIAEILGWDINSRELTSDEEDKAYEIHRETQYVLQIILENKTFDVLGTYKYCMCTNYHWIKENVQEKMDDKKRYLDRAKWALRFGPPRNVIVKILNGENIENILGAKKDKHFPHINAFLYLNYQNAMFYCFKAGLDIEETKQFLIKESKSR